jgi:phosphoglycerate dehydrogenase-like enzyme
VSFVNNKNGPSHQKIRLSIHNETKMPAAYFITEEIYSEFRNKHKDLAEIIDVRFFNDDQGIQSLLNNTDVLIASLMGGNLPLKKLLDAKSLRWIHFIGAGVDHLLPLDWMPSDAVLTKSLGAHLPNAVEYATTALLMLNNHVPFYVSNQRERRWERIFPTSIRGKTLLVIGVGAIGGAVASEAHRMGLKVLGVRKSGESHEHVDRMFKPEELEAALPQADFVFLSAALTPSTRGLVGARQFDKMKKGAGLLSISRGVMIDFDALAQALKSQQLSGAVVNALPSEPLPTTSPIWEIPNLIITPHIGTQDRNMFPHNVMDIFAENLKRYLAGKQMLFEVDPAKGY